MKDDDLSEALRALARGKENRTEIGRLRGVIDDVEAALSAGVSREAVLKTLHSKGFTMNLKTFESALYRIRKKQREGLPVTPKRGNPAPLAQDEKPSERSPAAIDSASGNVGDLNPETEKSETVKVGKFELNRAPRFEHNPKSDKTLLE